MNTPRPCSNKTTRAPSTLSFHPTLNSCNRHSEVSAAWLDAAWLWSSSKPSEKLQSMQTYVWYRASDFCEFCSWVKMLMSSVMVLVCSALALQSIERGYWSTPYSILWYDFVLLCSDVALRSTVAVWSLYPINIMKTKTQKN